MYCGATTKKGNMKGPRTHIVGTVGLVAAMAQLRIDNGQTDILCAVAHISSGKMQKIRGRVKTKDRGEKSR